MTYTPAERNFENIQFEKLRKKVDQKFNETHDELSSCYYDKKPFRNYGILDKETFDKLHGLIFTMRNVKFHEENLKQPVEDIIPEEKYNEIKDKDDIVIDKVSAKALEDIVKLKGEGIELII